MAPKEKIALLGTGLMGRPMAETIARAGYRLTVWNRTREKALSLTERGAAVARSPAEAIEAADGIVLMLADYPAICDALLSAEAAGALAGRTVLQMGTIAPEQSVFLSRQIEDRGADYLEAPVLGSIPEAAEGRLLVMAGAAPGQFDRWAELLSCLGPDPLLIGDVGKAAALKLAMNQLIAGLTASFSLSLALVQKSGVSTGRFMDILRKSALYAPTFDKKLDKMLAKDFSNPNFPAKHLAKDVRLFVDAARPLGLETAGIEGIRRIVEKAVEKGMGEDDYSAIYKVIYQGG
jgi:3-hydroxyisobutyrate dehydrogenase